MLRIVGIATARMRTSGSELYVGKCDLLWHVRYAKETVSVCHIHLSHPIHRRVARQ
jgi:hypothetical protein